jgi:hypothetical protein
MSLVSNANSVEKEQERSVFFFALDSMVPAQQIELVEMVFDKMFEVVKLVGDTVTLRLDPRFGGDIVFDLTSHLERCSSGDTEFTALVWSQIPDHVRQVIRDYIEKRLPGAYFINDTPGPDTMRWLVDNLPGKAPLTFVGKFFRVNGFLVALLTNFGFKTLYRVLLDRQSLTAKNIKGDVRSGLGACITIFFVKFLLAILFTATPASLVFAVSAVAGAAGARGWKKAFGE